MSFHYNYPGSQDFFRHAPAILYDESSSSRNCITIAIVDDELNEPKESVDIALRIENIYNPLLVSFFDYSVTTSQAILNIQEDSSDCKLCSCMDSGPACIILLRDTVLNYRGARVQK